MTWLWVTPPIGGVGQSQVIPRSGAGDAKMIDKLYPGYSQAIRR